MPRHKGEKDGGVPCPECKSGGTTCSDSRRVGASTRRRCTKCGHRFKTLEYATDSVAFNEPLADKVSRTLDEIALITARLQSIKSYIDFAKEE